MSREFRRFIKTELVLSGKTALPVATKVNVVTKVVTVAQTECATVKTVGVKVGAVPWMAAAAMESVVL